MHFRNKVLRYFIGFFTMGDLRQLEDCCEDEKLALKQVCSKLHEIFIKVQNLRF